MSARLLPPVAAPVPLADFWHGAVGLLRGKTAVAHVERDLGDALGQPHVYLVSSGKAALTLILQALERLSPRRQVIVPAYTCFSVPAAIVRAGLDVVPCDLEPGTLDFDYARLESLVARVQPLCVVPTHLFGIPADVARTRTLCHNAGTFVVEDAAQAFGTEVAGGPLGTLGDVGFYSFARGKTITCGHGGAIVTASPAIAAALSDEYSRLEEQGAARQAAGLIEVMATTLLSRPWLYWMPASLPFLGIGETRYDPAFAVNRLSGSQAGLLRHWRQRLTRLNEIRTTNAAALPAVSPLSAGIPVIRMPVICASREERDRLYRAGREKRLGVGLMYPGAITQIPELREQLHGISCPVAEDLAGRLLTVPVHPFVSTGDRHAIAQLLAPEGAGA